MAPTPTHCRECGAELDQPARGRKKTYCSQACRDHAKNKRYMKTHRDEVNRVRRLKYQAEREPDNSPEVIKAHSEWRAAPVDNRQQELEWLAGVLKASIEDAPPDRRGPLASQFRATLAELNALTEQSRKKETRNDPFDELAARRAARGGTSARPRPTRGRAI
nr:MAG TPA: DNA gyrase subunit A [Caudoviricetes sp.]